MEGNAMKITKRQLKQIIKEEKAKLFEQSREAKEGGLMADLDAIASAIEEIAEGMYGLVDPGEPRGAAGDEMASDLEMQVERLNDLYKKMVAHFESSDSGRTPTEEESGIPDSKRSVIHNRRPDW